MILTLDAPPLANILGFLALVGYIVTLLSTILKIVFPQTRKTGISTWLLHHRRLIGLSSFSLSVVHGIFFINQRNIDLFDLTTHEIYFQGVIPFVILILMAITSNHWSVKILKKNWKNLHRLTYLAMFLLIWHIWDKMSGHWTYLTPLGLGAITGISVLFLIRLWIEHDAKQQKIKKKEYQASLLVDSNQ
ncbi:MAG: iron reductase [Scytonema sp. RU_4_4]|nr:iron reductase [Scytonema sp. RU_4_4]NJR75028.1 iron reductase [Scytonema sp. CRU_2_7]